MPSLSLVPFQYSFPGFEFLSVAGYLDSSSSSGVDLEREQRSGLQWLKSVREYCMWRAGECWRRLNREGDRWKRSRWEYLDAARLITDVLSSDAESSSTESANDAALQFELDIARGGSIPLTLEETQLTNKPRAVLVDELMRDCLYSSRRALSGLAKRKLARMVTQSRERRAAAVELERRRA